MPGWVPYGGGICNGEELQLVQWWWRRGRGFVRPRRWEYCPDTAAEDREEDGVVVSRQRGLVGPGGDVPVLHIKLHSMIFVRHNFAAVLCEIQNKTPILLVRMNQQQKPAQHSHCFALQKNGSLFPDLLMCRRSQGQD